MTAREIAEALEGRKQGKDFIAKRPEHDDDHPSLGIIDGKNGKVLVFCRAGSKQTDGVAALKAKGLRPSANGVAIGDVLERYSRRNSVQSVT